MVVDDTLVDKLAKLSSLEVDQEKKQMLKTELADIVNFVENLNEVDVSHVDATFTTVEGGTPLREDEAISKEKLAKHIITHAPKSEEGYFIVPKIIE